MPELQRFIASLRAQLADLDRRGAALDAARADVEHRRERLATAIQVYEEGLPKSASVDRAPAPKNAPKTTSASDGALDILVSSGPKTRRELVNLLCPPVNENSLDSGLRRLKKRRQVRQDGDLYMAVDSSAAPAGSGAPSAAGDVADDRGKQRGPAQRSPAEPAGPAAPLPGD